MGEVWLLALLVAMAKSQCTDEAARDAIEKAVQSNEDDLLKIAESVQEAMERESGGRWEVVAAYCEFGYANWYTENICSHNVGKVHVLAWQD